MEASLMVKQLTICQPVSGTKFETQKLPGSAPPSHPPILHQSYPHCLPHSISLDIW